MPATKLKHKLMPADYEVNIRQDKPLVYKPITDLQETNRATRKTINPGTEFSSLGLAIPFQPSMWDEKSIQSVWNKGIEMVKPQLKDRYSEECTNTILTRLNNLFPKLNYNTHRKSLAIIISPDEEKIIYLSFPVKPVVCIRKSFSLLDLAANVQEEPDFYYFILNEGSVSLYDYHNKQLRKVYEQSNKTCQANLFKNALKTIDLLNSNYEKPVFVSGRPNMVEGFCNSTPYSKHFFTLLYHAFPFSAETIQSIVKEITINWSYWQPKCTNTKILLAQKAGILIANIDAVLEALGKCADGLLLVDYHLKNQLQQSGMAGSISQLSDEFMRQLEKFLERGNRIEITASGLLKDMGGIVLLPGDDKAQPTYWHSTAGGSLY